MEYKSFNVCVCVCVCVCIAMITKLLEDRTSEVPNIRRY
jgi:hypothetical protein